jgi:hypothetical protein
MNSKKINTLKLDFNYLQKCDEDLANSVREQFYRFESYLRKSIEKVIFEEFLSNTDKVEDNVKNEYWVSFCNLIEVRK